MHDKTLAGQQQQQVRWKRAVLCSERRRFRRRATASALSAPWAGAWASFTPRNIFPPKRKRRSRHWWHNLKAAYRARLEKLDWMGAATKAEALKKLDTYTIKVGYPDHPRDYSKLVITRRRPGGRRAPRGRGATGRSIRGVYSGPVDRSDWGMTPQTNDAYNGSCATSYSRPAFCRRRYSMPTPTPRSITARSAA